MSDNFLLYDDITMIYFPISLHYPVFWASMTYQRDCPFRMSSIIISVTPSF